MIDKGASTACRAALEAAYGQLVPGCAYYVLRDGKPFVDASFGQARRNDAADGALAYGADTIVHLASVSKFICAVAVMRLIEDWNEIVPHLRKRARVDGYRYVGPARPDDAALIQSAERHHEPLTLDTRVYDLMKSHLDHAAIAHDAAGYPGDGITDITLRGLLTHTSGLRDGLLKPEKLGLTMDQLVRENDPSGKAFFDLVRFTSVLFAEKTYETSGAYCNDGYSALGAFVEFLTGTHFEEWCRKKIFPSKAFNDIARRPVDMARAARYYAPGPNGSFLVGNYHPDYGDFGACGGWYASSSALCAWIDAVMKGKHFGGVEIMSPVGTHATIPAGSIVADKLTIPLLKIGRPIIHNPQQLFELGLGFDWGRLDVGYLQGKTKNGGTNAPGSSTNCRFVYLEGYGGYSVVAFTQVNSELNANPLLETGLPPLRKWLHDPTPLPEGPVAVPVLFDVAGLSRTVFWPEGAAAKTDQQFVGFAVESVTIGGIAAPRTNLFGTSTYAPGRTRNSIGFIKLEGFLQTSEGGLHTFRLSSDDGAMLWLDDALVVDNDASRSLTFATGQSMLAGGSEVPLLIHWYNIAYSGGLFLEWQRPGMTGFEAVPPERLRRGRLRVLPFGGGGPLPKPL